MNRKIIKSDLVKIILIGDSYVGKTSLLERFVNNSFDPNFSSTIGFDFKIKKLEINGREVKTQILDTSGNERFRSLTNAHYKNANGIFLVFDVPNQRVI